MGIIAFCFFTPSVSWAGLELRDTGWVSSDTKKVEVWVLDGAHEYNGLDLEILLEGGLLINSFSDTNRYINLWVNRPSLDDSLNTAKAVGVSLSSLPTNDYIFSFNVKVDKKEPGQIRVVKADLSRRDGLGSIDSFDGQVLVLDTVSGVSFLPTKDTKPPDFFTPFLTNGKGWRRFDFLPVAVFSTKDHGSGIYGYEVVEGGKVFFTNKNHYFIKRPFIKQSLTITALDYSGNKQSAVLDVGWFSCGDSACIDTKILIYLFVVLVIFFSVLVYVFVKSFKAIISR